MSFQQTVILDIHICQHNNLPWTQKYVTDLINPMIMFWSLISPSHYDTPASIYSFNSKNAGEKKPTKMYS